MTDEKNPRDADLEGLDWDQALAEWETNTFVPEVARDVVTDRPAALAGAVSKPLYRPPSMPPAPKPASSVVPFPRSAVPPTLPEPHAPAKPPAIDPLSFARDDEDDEATLIATIPPELLRSDETPSRASSRGGLSQIFSRDSLEGAPRSPSLSEGTSADAIEPSRPPRLPQATVPDQDEVKLTARHDTQALRDAARAEQLEAAAASVAPAGLATPAQGMSVRPPPVPTGPARSAPPPEEAPGRASVAAQRPSARPSVRAPSFAPPAPAAEDGASRATGLAPARTFHDEKPASAWLDEATRAAIEDRAIWLEEEARAVVDDEARARALLTCSEIHASAGDRERAYALACEARDLSPALALAHRQARGLMPWPPDPEDQVEALDAEVAASSTGPARVHSLLLVADALRARGETDAADMRLEQAASVEGADVRPAIAEVARALAQGDVESAAFKRVLARPAHGEAASDGPNGALRGEARPEAGFADVASAAAFCLRLRDANPADASLDPPAHKTANEIALRARRALDGGRLGEAARFVAELASTEELGASARWLAAALATPEASERARSVGWLEELVDQGEPDAARVLLARAVELGDRERISAWLTTEGVIDAAEIVTLGTLFGLPLLAGDAHLDATFAMDGHAPLGCAIAAVATPPDQDRARRVAGTPTSRAEVSLGRLLASLADPKLLTAALVATSEPDHPPVRGVLRGIAMELAAREGHYADVSRAVRALGETGGRPEGALAAALIAERAHDMGTAILELKAARAENPASEAPLRALASMEPVDLVSELNAVADECDDLRGAIARLEAVIRGENMLAEPTQAHLLERVHRSAPSVPVASFLAERIARRSGDVDEVLRWIRERRAATSDAVEGALDSVREALLVADREPELASERLRDAHRVRPRDVGLRDLYERMAIEPPADRASWREARAAESAGDARILLSLEAAHEYERVGDDEGAFRCVLDGAVHETSLGRIARERSELATGRVSRLADELLAQAKAETDGRARREAYERLAVLDLVARKDAASALLWHKSILEDAPLWKPSLRYIEQELIGEGREDDLEPVAAAIASSLRGSGPGEATAHAELAVRLLLHAGPGRWESAREMMELAASEGEPSLATLRNLQNRARAASDDAAFIAATRRLVDRSTRPAETAALLIRAGDAALRAGRLDEAHGFFEKAAVQDTGDVATWLRLAEVQARRGDLRGAAEAQESASRTSKVRSHQLAALYEAGRLWQDGARDDERATLAFEAAAALDLTHADVFERLSHLYAVRKMPAELAELLERRIAQITDPEERLAMDVKRGRLLLEVGETAAARRAFESALAQRPDDAAALSAFADLCLAESDWETAEQALVRLARLLPTAEEQRGVYARLGDLYSHRLLNLSRAEVALKEVLKRAPDDVDTHEKLVEIYRRQNDPARAVEMQQELVSRAGSADDKRRRILELAALHERAARDLRKAEKTLESARREAPQDVVLLRALAEFYGRHHQTPAVNILLDRAAADARRAIAGGQLGAAPFEIVQTVFDLRGKADAARTAGECLAAVEGRPAELHGAGERALDGALDDALAPEAFTPALRSLLARTGSALDAASPLDLRDLRALPLSSDAPLAKLAIRAAAATGLRGLQVLSSARLRGGCVPAGSDPPAIVIAEGLEASDPAATFLVFRAIKLVAARASVLGRMPPSDLSALVCAWLKCFNPTWQPKGVPQPALDQAIARVAANMPTSFEPDVGVLALEAAGALETGHASLGERALEWGNRVALVALGQPNAALDAVALATNEGSPARAPDGKRERATWIAQTPQARNLVTFGVSEAFAQIRVRLGAIG
jgi:predicted Zn-dependent protease